MEMMPTELSTTLEVKEPYILTETTDEEVVLSIHTPFKIQSEFIDSI